MNNTICSGGIINSSDGSERRALLPSYVPLRVVVRAVGLNAHQLRLLRESNTIRAKKLGKEWLYSMRDIIAWFNDGRVELERDADYAADCEWLARACGELMSDDASHGWYRRPM